MSKPLNNWHDLIQTPKSKFFKGYTQDTVFDRSTNAILSPSTEAMFTQSNARILLGHAANGMLRMAALPTQVYPAPTQTGEFGLGPGMYHHFDVVMYAGNLTYQLELEDGRFIDMDADDRQNETVYADHFIPLTTAREDDLEVNTVSFAPVAPDADSAPLSPAPLPGPAGALYVLILKNKGDTEIAGKVRLAANDLLVGHYEDAAPEMRAACKPTVNLRQHTLILSRPEGAVGVHLHNGKWSKLDAPFTASCDFKIAAGEQQVFETHIALGAAYDEVMPVIYDLHLRPALDWLNLTLSYWRARLGNLTVKTAGSDDGEFSRDIYIRSLFDNFNCLQTGADGNLIAHWQGAPSHGYGTVWGIDVEPTAVSVVHLCPEIAREAMLFFMNRSRVPKGTADHSVPILVAPVIIARKYLQATGDITFLMQRPNVIEALLGIMDHLLALKAPNEDLFPSRYSSDGPVGRRYDYGTNVKVWYTFDSMAYIMGHLGELDSASNFSKIALDVREAIQRTMVVDGPFGPQISGGTNLEEDQESFYLPEGVNYYDGEDTSSMLAPIYGICDFNEQTWINYHRFARSLWCPNFDQEFGALRWSPNEFGAGALDGTAFFSRLGGSVTLIEMAESLQKLRQNSVDEATGSAFWWPYGREYRRALTRCSQGQGAWAWQYLQQWLGISVDAFTHRLTIAPRGLVTKVDWEGFQSGSGVFDISWTEIDGTATTRIKNRSETEWTVDIGTRQSNAGALGALTWQTEPLQPGQEKYFTQPVEASWLDDGMQKDQLAKIESAAFGNPQGVIFKRFGPALLWGNWDLNKLWDMQAMPWALRFLVVNATGKDWTDVSVELTCPEGWTAQGREACHWTPPEHLETGVVNLTLGELPAYERTVAAFWIKALFEYEYVDPRIASQLPFHAVSQPGPGLEVISRRITETHSTIFKARLKAKGIDGGVIENSLDAPVNIVPYQKLA